MINKFLKMIDPYLKFIVLLSTGFYLIELSTGSVDSYHSHPIFLWTERFIAIVFTIEYALRWHEDATDHLGWHYPHSALGIIDFVSIMPFWVGFFVPLEWLHVIRTFRIFRLLKFFRYSRSLQLVALAFFRAGPALKPLCFSQLVIGLFCTVSIFEVESVAQPDKFTNLFDAAYFTMVTVATVGYGDLSPVTVFGRLIAMFTFITALAIFAGILGVLGSSFFKVMEEEIDPNVDPLLEFKKEKEKRKLMKA